MKEKRRERLQCEQVEMDRIPLGIYVHIPYCIRKCPYCDFNSYGVGLKPGNDAMPEAQYTDALLSELEYHVRENSPARYEVRSIFFGGGTPSLFEPESFESFLEHTARHFSLAADVEITMEANPGTLQEELAVDKLRGFKAAGINRISFGGQSFSPRKLNFLGRYHSPEDTKHAVALAHEAGFSQLNVDLMFGTKDETVEEWQSDLETLFTLKPTHISAYCLTIEPGTEFHRLKKKGGELNASEDALLELQTLTYDILEKRGFPRYEISNFAAAGNECRHNRQYWTGGEYLGLGAGAHGLMRPKRTPWGRRWSNIPGPQHYIERAMQDGSCAQRTEELTKELSQMEFFFLRMRLREGFSFSDYEKTIGEPISEKLRAEAEALVQASLLEVSADGYQLTDRGFLFADSVISRLSLQA